MIDPIEWLSAAAQLFKALAHHILVLIACNSFPFLVDKVGHVDDFLPHLVDRLYSIADVLSETLLIGRVLWRIFASV